MAVALSRQAVTLQRQALRRRAATRRGRRLPVVGPPKTQELEVLRLGLRELQQVRPLVTSLLEDLRAVLPRREDAEQVELPGLIKRRLRGLEVGAARGVTGVAELTKALRPTGQRIAQYQGSEMQRQIREAIGVELPVGYGTEVGAEVQDWGEQVAKLISTIPGQYLDEVARLVRVAARQGQRHETLAKELEARYGLAQRRAALIARDQVGKLYGGITKARQKEAGVKRFTWRTSLDERVREEHQALEGKVFEWAKGAPGEGIPGEPINCRCTAEPVLEDLLDALEEPPQPAAPVPVVEAPMPAPVPAAAPQAMQEAQEAGFRAALRGMPEGFAASVEHQARAFRSAQPVLTRPLSDAELQAVVAYTKTPEARIPGEGRGPGVDFRSLNRVLRGAARGSEKPSTSAEQRAVAPAAAVLNRALSKMPRYEGIVYRGIKPRLAAAYEVGQEVTELGFTSSTSREYVASGFGDLKLYIRSKTGRSISALSDIETEAEVLFQAGTRFRVLEKTATRVVMEEI